MSENYGRVRGLPWSFEGRDVTHRAAPCLPRYGNRNRSLTRMFVLVRFSRSFTDAGFASQCIIPKAFAPDAELRIEWVVV